MVNEISRREVLNNLIRFKDNLLEMRGEDRQKQSDGRGEEEKKKRGRRTYQVLLNRRTGDMRFAQKITSLERHIARKKTQKEAPEDWKEIRIIVHQEATPEAAHFEARDTQNSSLKASDIDPIAWRIASETLDVLNTRAEQVKPSDQPIEEAVLNDLSSIHLAAQKERIEELPGWQGALSRIDAERKLKGKPIGTYLMREGDELTLSISFHFAEENRLSIHPYLLTVVERENKIVDILLLQTNKGWLLYHDDPNLKDPILYHYHASAQGLLHSLGQRARHPLSS